MAARPQSVGEVELVSCDGGTLGGVLFQHGDRAVAVHALDDGGVMRALAVELIGGCGAVGFGHDDLVEGVIAKLDHVARLQVARRHRPAPRVVGVWRDGPVVRGAAGVRAAEGAIDEGEALAVADAQAALPARVAENLVGDARRVTAPAGASRPTGSGFGESICGEVPRSSGGRKSSRSADGALPSPMVSILVKTATRSPWRR